MKDPCENPNHCFCNECGWCINCSECTGCSPNLNNTKGDKE